jgi:ubiquinone biosynthesis protein
MALLQRCRKLIAVVVRRVAIVIWYRTAARVRNRTVEASFGFARQFRLALEELGPTFVKLGQLLSARTDVTPTALQHELAMLRDHAPSIPHATVVAELERTLGPSATDLFTTFELAPVACASIGQVHRATLRDGRRVAVKIRRPGVRAEIDADLALLRVLLRAAERLSRRARALRPVTMLDEFAALLRAETDYTTEAGNIEAVRRTFEHDDLVMIPSVMTDLGSDSLLIMDWIDGIPLNRGAELDAAGTNRSAVARAIVHAYAAMIFQSDCFHADPHPGNLIARSDERLALVDFGEVGLIEPSTRTALVRLLAAVLGRDSDGLADALLAVSRSTRTVDRAELGAQLASLLRPVASSSLQEMKIGPMLRDLLHVLRAHGLMLPADLAVLIKTMIVCEATTDEMDPAFQMHSFLTELGTFGLGTTEQK